MNKANADLINQAIKSLENVNVAFQVDLQKEVLAALKHAKKAWKINYEKATREAIRFLEISQIPGSSRTGRGYNRKLRPKQGERTDQFNNEPA